MYNTEIIADVITETIFVILWGIRMKIALRTNPAEQENNVYMGIYLGFESINM